MRRNTRHAGILMDTGNFWSREKLRGSKHVVSTDRNAGWSYFSLVMLFQMQHVGPTACLGKVFSLQRKVQYLDSCVKSGAMPKHINRSFLQLLLLNIFWGKILKRWFSSVFCCFMLPWGLPIATSIFRTTIPVWSYGHPSPKGNVINTTPANKFFSADRAK